LVEKQVAQIKEILTQEFEFRKNQLENHYRQSQKAAKEQLEQQNHDFVSYKERELENIMTKNKTELQHDKIKLHAQTTQELYADINQSLQDKYANDLRYKLTEQQAKQEKHHQRLIQQLKLEHEKELALERKRLALVERKNAQLEDG